MKFLSILLIGGAAALAGCSTTGNTAGGNGNANLRGTNTNTGYVNSDAVPKPTVPVNPTVVGPASPATQNGGAMKPSMTPAMTPAMTPKMTPKATK